MDINQIIKLYSLIIFIFCVFIILINLRWIIITLRKIADNRNPGGYFKLMQTWLIIIISAIFCIIAGHYIFFPGTVDKIDLILTVIVGWLGMIMGRFFGESAMESLLRNQKMEYLKIKEDGSKMINLSEKLLPLIDKKLSEK
ncbi:MAG: hypothetical protein QGH47_07185 [Candidatus Woesearchaeota archaeon]|jgi:hypothetical protein|nr:hypothetical protein [Candidatus Woesearchaeota archaeon]